MHQRIGFLEPVTRSPGTSSTCLALAAESSAQWPSKHSLNGANCKESLRKFLPSTRPPEIVLRAGVLMVNYSAASAHMVFRVRRAPFRHLACTFARSKGLLSPAAATRPNVTKRTAQRLSSLGYPQEPSVATVPEKSMCATGQSAGAPVFRHLSPNAGLAVQHSGTSNLCLKIANGARPKAPSFSSSTLAAILRSAVARQRQSLCSSSF